MADLVSTLRAFLAELRRRRVVRAGVVYAVVAWVVIQVAAVVFPTLHLPDWSVTLVVVLVLAAFPVALVLAWAFELTPAGVRRTQAAPGQAPSGEDAAEREETAPGDDAAEAAARARWMRLLLVLMVTAASAAAGWLAWGAWLGPDTARTATAADADADALLAPTRIAVLPFDDHSADGGLAYLARGLTEHLTHELAQVDGLDVLPRTAVTPYRSGPQPPFDSIARRLEAGSLVEGSVARSGERVRVYVQLIDGNTATHLDSREFEIAEKDLLQARDRVAGEAARLLRKRLGRKLRLERSRGGTESQEALRAFYRGLRLRDDGVAVRDQAERDAARRLFRRADSVLAEAEDLDPDWPGPPLRRGWLALDRALVGGTLLQIERELIEDGLGHAERALDLEPGSPETLELRGTLRYWLGRTAPEAEAARESRRAAERDLEEAVERDPSLARAWAVLSEVRRSDGRLAEAIVAARRSREADAFLTSDRRFFGLMPRLLLDAGDYEEALTYALEARSRYPHETSFVEVHLMALASTGGGAAGVDSAWATAAELEKRTRMRVWPWHFHVAAALAHHGLADSARAVLGRTRSVRPDHPFTDYYEAYVRLVLGDRQAALDHLEAFARAQTQYRSYLARDSWFAPLRGDPRFQQIVGPAPG